MVKWKGQCSEKFDIKQGVRQGGVLSTDMYTFYLNPFLNRLCETNQGAKIGEVDCTAPATADDLTAMSDHKPAVRTHVSTADDCSCMEHYLLNNPY